VNAERLTVYRFGGSGPVAVNLAGNAAFARGTLHRESVFVAYSAAAEPGTANVFGSFLGQARTTLISRAAANQQAPVLATDGNAVLAAWTEHRGELRQAILARLLTLDGTPSTPVVEVANAVDVRPPAVAFNGTDYVAVWQEFRFATEENYRHLISRRITRGGVAADVVTISQTAHIDADPAVATDGTNVLIVWTDGRPATPRLRAALLPPNRYITPPSIELPANRAAAVAWNGTAYLIVAETNDGALRSMVVDRNGGLVSSTDATIAVGDQVDREPSLAWNGSRFALVFTRGGNLYSTFLNANGTRASADTALTTTGGVSHPRVSWSADHFFVTFERGDVHRDLFHMPLDATTPPRPLSVTALNESDATILPLANRRWLVAYQRQVAELNGSHRIFTRVFTRASRQRAVRQ
jgi:hypothetical protein